MAPRERRGDQLRKFKRRPAVSSARNDPMTIEPRGQALRRRADRALRLARAISDEQAAQALRLHASSLLDQAEAFERGHWPLPPPNAEQQRPAQQQQQIQPGTDDKME